MATSTTRTTLQQMLPKGFPYLTVGCTRHRDNRIHLILEAMEERYAPSVTPPIPLGRRAALAMDVPAVVRDLQVSPTGRLAVTGMVAAAAPTLRISGNASVNEGAPYTLNLSAQGGAGTIQFWTINWGDGSAPEVVPGNPSAVTHGYPDGPRACTILASATDEFGTYAAAAAGGNAQVAIDPTFNHGGEVTVNFTGSTGDYVNAMVLQPDGKVVVAGYTSGGNNNIALARYNPDGTLDTTFGTGGRVVTDFGGSESANSLALDAGGRILVGGNFGLARYSPEGVLDTTFGLTGRLTTITNLKKT